MDRLPALIVLLAACDAGSDTSAPPPSRVDVAKVGQRQAASVDAFCDVHPAAGKAAAFAWPPLTGAPPPAARSTWRWINVWATWCKPCVEEMPRLARWTAKLATAGRTVDLAFVSVDESDDDVAAYRKLHPDAPATLRLADGKAQATWFTQLGLTGSPQIPIHIFVDGKGRVRCVRSGGVRDQDYAAVERLLAE